MMLSGHIVRYSFRQACFDTPTVGHFHVIAADADEAVNAVHNQYRGHAVSVEYIAPSPLAPSAYDPEPGWVS